MASRNQKEFLKNLGYPNSRLLSFEEASAKISELLATEKAVGVRLKCPYCKKPITTRPRSKKKCPHCQRIMIHVNGRLLTEQQLVSKREKESVQAETAWFRESHKERRAEIRDDVREERKFQREFGEGNLSGYRIVIGPACTGAKDKHGMFVPLEIAQTNPELLPPYAGVCCGDTCECNVEAVWTGERLSPTSKMAIGKDTVTTVGQHSRQHRSRGCMGVLVLAILLIAIWSLY